MIIILAETESLSDKETLPGVSGSGLIQCYNKTNERTYFLTICFRPRSNHEYGGNTMNPQAILHMENGRKIVFLFQNARCTAIYCDSAGRITNALREDYDRNLGELVNGLSCRMKLKEVYQTRFVTRQFYEWYQFEEWKDMYETLKLE